jgi:hypothetical protein
MTLVERAKNVLMQPKTEWPVIAEETVDTATLYKTYVLPLAAIPSVASLIGMTLFGLNVPFAGHVRVPFGSALGNAVFSYVLTLVGVYILAAVIKTLAPTFSAEPDMNRALKVSAYSSTASWLAGVFALIPALGLLQLVGSIYSLYLLHLGLGALMSPPEDKALAFTVTVVIAAVVLFVLVGVMAAMVFGVPGINPQ